MQITTIRVNNHDAITSIFSVCDNLECNLLRIYRSDWCVSSHSTAAHSVTGAGLFASRFGRRVVNWDGHARTNSDAAGLLCCRVRLRPWSPDCPTSRPKLCARSQGDFSFDRPFTRSKRHPANGLRTREI